MILHRSAESKQKELAAHKAQAIQDINQLIGAVRLLFITDIAGQQMIYAEKEREANSFLAAVPEPSDLAPYPFIFQEMNATGMTAYEVAQMFLNLSVHWRAVGSSLEGVRINANATVDEASTRAEIESALGFLRLTLEGYR
ncbi:hypothetical protein SAMN05444149_108110 [Pseudosulfitobacter pseudonitzschiae]|uniref:Uncharacterized protein n=1 Tax=Pseudosulfitobacter pseudonitzschiae TaxID=1402135 RepID=A0A073IUI6_9RHOB|nr:hypothetical protein [Pseudosulfitobacter pseudonitzschiae]KEJ93993.1 hypothetical protein SUH3_12035 [Pseudosulfitobacter pseudonitzschiae]SHG01923.1 hypothetical protein SAMN05444149_108110 [Pseudosulfitobacter pseudonitzschiae]